jgi:multisubunit Na+/H+ antiporter MnhC subunit
MTNLKPQALIVTGIIIGCSFLLWLTLVIFAYVVDDWKSPPADEKSVPAASRF